MNQGVEFPRHNKVIAAIERHPAMVRQNQTNVCLACQNGTTKKPETGWRRNGIGAPPPNQHRQPTPDPMPSLPRTPPVPPGDTEGAHISQIDNFAPVYVYSHTPLPNTQLFNLDAYAQDSQHDKDYYPDMLTDEGTSTG